MDRGDKPKIRTLAELCHELDTEEASKSLFLIVNDGTNYDIQCRLAHKREGKIQCPYLENHSNGNLSYVCTSPEYKDFASKKIEELRKDKNSFIHIKQQSYAAGLLN